MDNQSPQQQMVSDTIAQAATKGKFLDFRNNLALAIPEDYAMIHGAGGRKHGMKSTIKLLITDYSAGRGNSKVVQANVSPELISYLLEVCKMNVTAGTSPAPKTQTCADAVHALLGGTEIPLPPGQGEPGAKYVAAPVDALMALPGMEGFAGDNRQAMDVYKRLQTASLGLPPDANTGAQYVAVPIGGLEALLAAVDIKPQQPTMAGGTNYTYRQERVNVYKKAGDGMVPVSVLTITREGTRKNGEISRLPWTVKIQNFVARPVQQPNQTTSYNYASRQQQVEAFVSLSDYDMYRCLYRVSRFVEIWEMTYGPGLICEGLRRKEAQRQANQQGGGQSYPPQDGGYYDDYYPED